MQPKKHFTVIGLSDNHHQWLAPDITDRIARGCVFSGGLRHHELIRHLLPSRARWIDITVPLARTFEAYAPYPDIVVFASGDPLFYGFAATLRREFPEADIEVLPTFNSLQMLAHRILLPYQDMRCVSLTGRPWDAFDGALIRGEALIGLLTDRRKTPPVIARRMAEYGFTNYSVTVGEQLGNERSQRIRTFSVDRLAHTPEADFEQPNCLILQQTVGAAPLPFGLPEANFELLDHRANMITKAPIRLASLAALGLPHRTCLWDIGFCTGSVSIEARRMAPHMQVESFEIRPECEAIIQTNARRFSAPGIHVHMGDFLLQPLDSLPHPDAIFIGGHGGHLADIIERCLHYLLPGGCIVLNAVSPDSIERFDRAAQQLHLTTTLRQRICLDQHNPILILRTQNL